MTKPSTFYTLDQWFSNFSLYQDHLERLLKWIAGPRVSDFSRSGLGWENAFLTSPGWHCCCWCRPPLAEPVTALSHKTGSYQKKPMALVQQQQQQRQQNVTSICVLELKENLQKQIFLSERICLAFTPRNRPHTGSS